MPLSAIVACVCIAAVAFVLQRILRSNGQKSRVKYPPGPPGRILLGNLLDIPKRDLWLRVDEWAKQYGAIVHLNLLGRHFIFLNDEDVARELLEKRSKIYSDRPTSIALDEMLGTGFNFGFMRYGERWRTTRRIFLEVLRKKEVQNYDVAQEKQTRALLNQLNAAPKDFYHHLLQFATSGILETVYGVEEAEYSGENLVKVIENGLHGISTAAETAIFLLVEVFPFLRYWPAFAPGGGFKKRTLEWKRDIKKMTDVPYSASISLNQRGLLGQPSCMATWLSKISSVAKDHDGGLHEQESQNYIKDAASAALLAGIESTATALKIFLLAMMLYPEVQAKAHEELDRVVGRSRLPNPSDEQELVYVKAILKEVLRWRPIAPLGVPHTTVSDDEYNGFFIPKGTQVVANAWTMLRNEDSYGSHVDEFDPERFMQQGRKDPTPAFGFGRRICPGRHFAERTLILAISSILHVYRIGKPDHIVGELNPKDYKFTSGLVTEPEPFECSIVARFPGAENLAQASFSNEATR